jgi:nucleolar GTP-binding protein
MPEEFKEKLEQNKIGKYLNLPFKKRKTLKDVQEEMGGAGVFNFPNQEHFLLENPDWKYDKVPEIWNGMNIADYVDPDIEQKLAILEKEEEERISQLMASRNWEQEEAEEREWREGKAIIQEIESEKKMVKNSKKIEGNTKKKVQKDREAMLNELRMRLDKKGSEGNNVMKKVIRTRKLRSKRRAENRKIRHNDPNAIIEEGTLESEGKRLVRRRTSTNANPRNISVSRREEFTKKQYKGERIKRKIQKKIFKAGLKGDGDRGIYTKKPKHLFSGKMGNGTRDWR